MTHQMGQRALSSTITFAQSGYLPGTGLNPIDSSNRRRIMQLVRKNGHWLVALAGIVSLAYAAGMMHERLPLPGLGATHARETQAAQEPPEAAALSSGFRHAAKAALPAMVSIEVRGK